MNLKPILTALAALFCCCRMQGQPHTDLLFTNYPKPQTVAGTAHAIIEVGYSNQLYWVHYDYDTNSGYIPSGSPDGKPVYFAKITVWLNGKQVGRAIPGNYIESGGPDDMPLRWVKNALMPDEFCQAQPTHTEIELGRLGTRMSTVICDDSIVTLHRDALSLVASLNYDFSTNWTTTNATEKQTLLRTNIYMVPGPWPKDLDPTITVFYGHTETQLIYSIERVEQQSGTVSSNVFVTLDFKGQKKRVDLESTPMPWPATQTVTNHSETKPSGDGFHWSQNL